MEKFVALPVAGDAFLALRRYKNSSRAKKSILVDSGRSGRILADLLDKELSSQDHIEIAVCTHADSDHADGFTTLLDDWRDLQKKKEEEKATATKKTKTTTKTKVKLIRQFWLPGVWSNIVRDIIKNPSDFFNEFYEEVNEFPFLPIKEIDRRIPPRRFGSLLQSIKVDLKVDGKVLIQGGKDDDNSIKTAGDSKLRKQSIKGEYESDWMREIIDGFKEKRYTKDRCTEALHSVRAKIIEDYSHVGIGRNIEVFLLSLIDTAEKILLIAFSAIEYDVPIRWFDYGEFVGTGNPSGGDPKNLIPVNSVEQSRLFRIYRKATLLYLTTENVQCLSFYSPGHSFNPGILFCGDSPMEYDDDGCLKPFEPPKPITSYSIIVTAPHHGSKSNTMAYYNIRSQFIPFGAPEKLFWVRSGAFSNHPGGWYREIPSHCRICTSCPYNELPKKNAELIPLESKVNPTFVPFGHRCTC